MNLKLLGAALAFSVLLTACGTTRPPIYVGEEMLRCPEDVMPPHDGVLTDNEIAELIVKLDERGDICAQRLGDVREWLESQGAVVSP